VNSKQTSIGREAALALVETRWWESKSPREIAEFTMRTRELCCPFAVFHEAIEKTLDRPVFTHELGLGFDGLWNELFNGQSPPTFDEIMDLIPADKRIVAAI
jgi:hypothetical protein